MCIIALFAVLKAVSYFDLRMKKRNNESLIEKCKDSKADVTVLMLVPKDSSEKGAETLFSLIQNASCPKSLKIIIIQNCEVYEQESRLLKIYKEMCNFKGRFSNHFLELVELYQVFTEYVFVEALTLITNERKLILVVDLLDSSQSHATSTGLSGPMTGPNFLLNWDTFLPYEELRGPAFGGIYCGAGLSHDSTPRPSFTSMINGRLESWPLWRAGPPVQVVWPSSPMLLETQVFKKMSGLYFSEALMQVPGRFWTTREPIAIVQRLSGFFNQSKTKSANFGVSDNAEPLEIIMKYGSISGYNWSLAS